MRTTAKSWTSLVRRDGGRDRGCGGPGLPPRSAQGRRARLHPRPIPIRATRRRSRCVSFRQKKRRSQDPPKVAPLHRAGGAGRGGATRQMAEHVFGLFDEQMDARRGSFWAGPSWAGCKRARLSRRDVRGFFPACMMLMTVGLSDEGISPSRAPGAAPTGPGVLRSAPGSCGRRPPRRTCGP